MTTYSNSLKLELPGDGQQTGTWGQTTNKNFGDLLEQAICDNETIVMFDANHTLTNLNGTLDEARNAVLIITGTNTAQRDIIAPTENKLYTIYNNTSGGFSIRIIGSSGTGVVIPNGMITQVFFDGTNYVPLQNGVPTNFVVYGNLGVAGTTILDAGLTGTTATFSGAISAVSPTFTGTVTVPTATPGDNTTKAATTAFVTSAITAQGLGTMSAQNANNVSITGGSITGITDLAVADGGTGASTFTANSVVLGNGTSALNGNMVAPGTSGNVLTSNGTTWASSAAPGGVGKSGTAWNNVAGSRSLGSSYTNNNSYPIQVNAGVANSGINATTLATLTVGGVTVSSNQVIVGNNIGSNSIAAVSAIIPPGTSYTVTGTGSLSYWAELY